MQINFQDKSTTDLKASAYDIVVALQQYQALLQSINEEIARRSQEEAKQAVKGLKKVEKEEEPKEVWLTTGPDSEKAPE